MNDKWIFYIGIGSGICTAVSLLPQLIKIIKDKKADDISYGMPAVLTAGQIGWIIYGFLKKDYPIIATNAFSVIVNILIVIFTAKHKGNKT
jgi:MtN3 and saliva related transmembrane protein